MVVDFGVVVADVDVVEAVVDVVEAVVLVVDAVVDVVEAVVLVVDAVVEVVEDDAVVDVEPSWALDGNEAAPTNRNSAKNTDNRRVERRSRRSPPSNKVPISVMYIYRLRTRRSSAQTPAGHNRRRNTTVIVGRLAA